MTGMGDLGLMLLGFGVASLLKFAQGSTTVAMITASAMMAALVNPITTGLPSVFLAAAIGSGSLVGSWMNDSGFWIFAKMSGLTELETLKTWSPALAIIGCSSLVITLIYALVYRVFF